MHVAWHGFRNLADSDSGPMGPEVLIIVEESRLGGSAGMWRKTKACPVQTYPWGRWQSTPLCAACQTGCHHAISEDSLGLELELGLLVDRAARQHRPESNSSTSTSTTAATTTTSTVNAKNYRVDRED